MSEPLRAVLPRRALLDQRLCPRDFRVLGALCSLLARKTGPAPLHRQDIQALCALPETTVSRATSRLCTLGWLVKSGQGRCTEYAVVWDFEPAGNRDPRVHGSEQETVTPHGHGLETSNRDPRVHGSEQETVTPVCTVSQTVTPHSHGSPETVTPVCTVSESGTVTPGCTVPDFRYKGTRARTRSGFILNTYPQHSDLIRSESLPGESCSLPGRAGVTDMLQCLIAHGMPPHLAKKPADMQILSCWAQQGITVEQVQQACARANDAKTDGKPWGPRYLNRVLESIIDEQKETKHGANEHFAGSDYEAATWCRR